MTGARAGVESPWRLSLAVWRAAVIRAYQESSDDNVGLAAAGVAFYCFLALAPMISAVVLIYGIFAEPDTVVDNVRSLMAVMPRDVALSIGEQLMTVVHGSDGRKGLAVLLAIALALFGARNGAGALITGLNIAYDAREKRGFIQLNLVALAITLAAVLLIVLAALSVAALAAIGEMLPHFNDALLIVGAVLGYALLVLAGAMGAAALYRFAPCRPEARWRWISPGAILAALLWLAITLGFGAYAENIGHFGATYGALAAVIALLTWMYLSSYVLLFCAELNSELEPKPEPAADPPSALRQGEGNMVFAAPVVAARSSAEINISLARPETEPRWGAVTAIEGAIVARTAASAARVVGLPGIGWITSATASLGLTMLRRPEKRRMGLALVALAAGVSCMRPRRYGAQ